MTVPVYNQTPNVGNRPLARKDANGNLIPQSFDDQTFRGDYTGTDLIYKGFARVGSATSNDVWQIAKMTYDGSHNLTSILWPQNPSGNASNDYEFEWDDRAGYTYV